MTKFYNWIKKYWKEVTIVILMIIVACLTTCNQNKSNEIKVLKHNIEVGEVEYKTLKDSTKVAIAQIEILEKANKDLKEEVKGLETKPPKVIVKTEYVYVVDSIVMKDTIKIIDGDTIYMFNYRDEWVALNGHHKDEFTTIDSLSMYTPLTVGMTEDYKIFVKSKCPYLNITSIEGSVVDKKKFKQRRWSLGLYLGFGFQYGILTNRIDIGPQFGVGVNYRLW